MNLFKTVSLQNAILVLKVARFLQNMLFILPTVILFYQYKGLTTGDFFLIQGLFSIVALALEIPTGYIGDLFSRKKVIILSLFSFFFGHLIWFLFKGFFFIFLGEFFMAIALALYSGTAEAYLHDILEKQNRTKDILKEQGRLDSISILGTVTATFVGASMYQHLGPDATLFIETLTMFAAFAIVLQLPDIKDNIRQADGNKSKFKDITNIVKYACNHPEIKWLMIYPSVLGAGTYILAWGLQPLMELKEIPIFLFGIFIGIHHLFRCSLSHFADKISKHLTTNKLAILLFFILIFGYSTAFFIPIISNQLLIYLAILLIALSAGSQILLRAVSSAMIHHRIKSNERATILSVKSMFYRIAIALTTISAKFLIDGHSIQISNAVLGSAIILITAYCLVKLLKLNISNENT